MVRKWPKGFDCEKVEMARSMRSLTSVRCDPDQRAGHGHGDRDHRGGQHRAEHPIGPTGVLAQPVDDEEHEHRGPQTGQLGRAVPRCLTTERGHGGGDEEGGEGQPGGRGGVAAAFQPAAAPPDQADGDEEHAEHARGVGGGDARRRRGGRPGWGGGPARAGRTPPCCAAPPARGPARRPCSRPPTPGPPRGGTTPTTTSRTAVGGEQHQGDLLPGSGPLVTLRRARDPCLRFPSHPMILPPSVVKIPTSGRLHRRPARAAW